MRKVLFAIVLAAAVTPEPAYAIGCLNLPGVNSFIGSKLARGQVSVAHPKFVGKFTYPAAGFVCAADSTNATASAAVLSKWITANVCVFNFTTGGACTIRGGDGLPVELLRFGVE